MPSAVESRSEPPRHDDLDNYDVGELSDDNPFRSSPSSSKKRKEPDSGLGIDEEVSVQKRARVPNIKLDEDRLLSANGIPKLRSRAHDLKLKGKGHEFGDAARLLSFYQLWLDDLFPKARFLDALAMVEKSGHKKKLMVARSDWINEGKPKSHAADGDDGELDSEPRLESAAQPTAPRPDTPSQDQHIPDDDDIYDATPRRTRPTVPIVNNDEPDDDDLDALMAESAGQDASRNRPQLQQEPGGDDDLEALIAEAEGHDAATAKQIPTPAAGNDFAEDEAAMEEMEGLW